MGNEEILEDIKNHVSNYCKDNISKQVTVTIKAYAEQLKKALQTSMPNNVITVTGNDIHVTSFFSPYDVEYLVYHLDIDIDIIYNIIHGETCIIKYRLNGIELIENNIKISYELFLKEPADRILYDIDLNKKEEEFK